MLDRRSPLKRRHPRRLLAACRKLLRLSSQIGRHGSPSKAKRRLCRAHCICWRGRVCLQGLVQRVLHRLATKGCWHIPCRARLHNRRGTGSVSQVAFGMRVFVPHAPRQQVSLCVLPCLLCPRRHPAAAVLAPAPRAWHFLATRARGVTCSYPALHGCPGFSFPFTLPEAAWKQSVCFPGVCRSQAGNLWSEIHRISLFK